MFARDLVKNGVVCPGADAELAALHPRRSLLETVSEMRATDSQLRGRPQQPGKKGRGEKELLLLLLLCFVMSYFFIHKNSDTCVKPVNIYYFMSKYFEQ